jgi:site-specific DNA-methyltransferase (adenine-specific)
VKAFALADNRSAELAEWDEQVLDAQLQELELAEFDVEAIGFETTVEPEPVIEDEIPEVVEPKAKLGDVWLLGRHRLMCGDSTVVENVDKLLQGKKADMAFTDPPYGVEYTGGVQFAPDGTATKNNREMIKNDNLDIYADVFRILAQFVNGPCYVWFAGNKAATVYTAAQQYGQIHNMLVWHKTGGGYSNLSAHYKENKEPFLYWKPKGSTLRWSGPSTETTVWSVNKDRINEFHPTQKPVALAAKAITNHDAKSVLDLFGGSGSTLIACEQTDRTCFMMELDPKYVDVIIARWEKLTGDTAVLIEG